MCGAHLSARDPHESATSHDHAQDQDVALAGPSTPPRDVALAGPSTPPRDVALAGPSHRPPPPWDLALARGLVLEDGVCGCAGVVAVDE